MILSNTRLPSQGNQWAFLVMLLQMTSYFTPGNNGRLLEHISCNGFIPWSQLTGYTHTQTHHPTYVLPKPHIPHSISHLIQHILFQSFSVSSISHHPTQGHSTQYNGGPSSSGLQGSPFLMMCNYFSQIG